MRGRHAAPDLADLAGQAMRERGLEPEFPREVLREVERLPGPAQASGEMLDLRDLPWFSIDNDDSRDLDQLTVGEALPEGAIRIHAAIADVDGLVRKGDVVDLHARHNTTSVYTPARIFPMLPERLSTDLTSLNPDEDRLAVVLSFTVDAEGHVRDPEITRALVRSIAKLAYSSVGAWLEGEAPAPAELARHPELPEQVRLQDRAAQALRENRYERGALDLQTIEPRATLRDGEVVDLRAEEKNRSHELIEDIMIAANGVAARFLEERGYPSFRRVVRSPERWDRIVDLAAQLGETLPGKPDNRALHAFLRRRRAADPVRFPDLSLAVIKLLGPGEYVAHLPGLAEDGHFGLAVRDYSHSTAPNRRYPDVITQRLLKAAMEGRRSPYSETELHEMARHCTLQEDAAKKVERQMRKSAAALLLSGREGEQFEGIVTGAAPKGTWVRILHPPVEGRVVAGERGLDVGDRVRVRLVETDVARGWIDFARA